MGCSRIPVSLERGESNIVVDGSEVQARSLGISISPSFSETADVVAVVESMLVVNKDYFDRQDAILAELMANS